MVDPELRISLARRFGQLAAQGLAICVPAPFLLFGFENAMAAGWVMFSSELVALLLWSSTAATTRFVRGPAVLAGPLSVVLLVVIAFVSRTSETERVLMGRSFGDAGMFVGAALLLALLPFRPPERSRKRAGAA